MGRDKALLEIDGETFLARAVRMATTCCDQVAIACPEIERYRADLPPSVQWIPEFHPDPEHPPGPLSALATTLPHLCGDWILVLACDLPQLSPETLCQWRNELTDLDPSVLAAVPKMAQGWEPLAAFYRPNCLAPLQAWLAGDRHDFQGWLDQLGPEVHILTVPSEALLFNCNTPADLEQLSS
jgi:molybdopterin-guanine dinucleotide biosynthesis protein A